MLGNQLSVICDHEPATPPTLAFVIGTEDRADHRHDGSMQGEIRGELPRNSQNLRMRGGVMVESSSTTMPTTEYAAGYNAFDAIWIDGGEENAEVRHSRLDRRLLMRRCNGR